MICKPCGHRWRLLADRLVPSAEVVERDEQRSNCRMVKIGLAASIRQSRVASKVRPNRQVEPLDVAGRNQVFVGLPNRFSIWMPVITPGLYRAK